MPLLDRRLLIVSGKGGVGKSTVSAALALTLSRAGLRTLVCEVNTQERISALLQRPRVGPDIGALEENLWGVNVEPAEAMREYALMVVKFKSIYTAVFENRFVRAFLRFIPSLQELVMIGKVLYHLEEKLPDGTPRFDRVVLDAPATGHALTFLSVPMVLQETVPAGTLQSESMRMRGLLSDAKLTGAVLVSTPEELPVSETLDLHAALVSKLGISPLATVLNATSRPRFSAAELAALAHEDPALGDLAARHEARAQLSEESARRLAPLGPLLKVPRVFEEPFGRAAIEAIARALAPQLGGADGA
jgi:anion-transporting  ArsA/GET3 family ATPase